MSKKKQASSDTTAEKAEQPKKKRPDLKSVWSEARHLIWERRWRFALGLLLILVNRLAGIVLPGSSKILVDEILPNQDVQLLTLLAFAVAAATIVQASTSFFLTQLLSVTAQRAITEMRKSVQQHVMRLPAHFFDSTKSGVLISRIMTDAEGIRNLVGTGLVQLLGGLITAALSLAVLLYLNWKLTVITLLVLLVFGVSMVFAFKWLRPVFRERGELNARVTGRLGEALGGVRIVKAYTSEKREDLIFARGAHNLFRNVSKTIIGIAILSAASTVIFGVTGVLIMSVGGRAIIAGNMTLGDFVMYIFFTGMVATPMIQISSIGTQVSEAFAGLDRIHELRRQATEDEQGAERSPIREIRGDIRFENVVFEYDPGVPVLRDVSFTAEAGSTTALVGSSGAGKSTLTSLVMAFDDPKEGRILIDGRDLSTIRLHDYRSKLGVVLQENFLFDGSVMDNIRYSKTNASLEEVREVCRIANCADFIESFEKQYDTVVGERGVKLSGGQRQRIAIARAILADPSILILDEATSSLDSESEALIQEGLHALRQGRTTFVIAHRLSTIQSADQILVLENGQIIERGKHRELLELQGRYRELYDKQYKLEKNLFINPGEDPTEENDEESDSDAKPASGRIGTSMP